MRIARVFPRKTKASPIDELSFFGPPPLICLRMPLNNSFSPYDIDEVHVSVIFTYDLKKAEWLAHQWELIAPVKIGGPGTGMKGEEFIPGMYIRPGYTITSRGCPNRCWFCSVWKRDGDIRELPIKDGWNLLDDNILACSESHIRAVFEMLKRQPHPIRLEGGLEAARLKPWHIELLSQIKLHSAFFSFDTPDDLYPLGVAAKMLDEANVLPSNRHRRRCYVLVGYPKDTLEQALSRIEVVTKLGYFPMAMVYRDETGRRDQKWMKFQKRWANPYRIGAILGERARREGRME